MKNIIQIVVLGLLVSCAHGFNNHLIHHSGNSAIEAGNNAAEAGMSAAPPPPVFFNP